MVVSSVPPLKRRLFESLRILCIDIGGTRTKFMYQHGSSDRHPICGTVYDR